LWLIWQESTLRSNELAKVNSFFLSDTLFGKICATVAFNAGFGYDPTKSTHLFGFLPIGIVFGLLFSVLKPLPRFIVWASMALGIAICAEHWFDTHGIIIPFGGPTVLISACYLCGTLIHLETEKIERTRNLAMDLQVQAEQERKRIAKDLHDESLPSLSRVMRLADQLHETYANDPIPQEIRSRLESTVSEMRRVINDLHPAVLDNLGLAASIQHLVDRLGQDSQIQVSFADNSKDSTLPPFQALCVYRIAQEALNNVEKHSGATLTEVALDGSETTLHLRISDNGNGEVRRKPESYGLQNIEDRAKLIGAKVEWKAPSNFVSGTLLVVTIPINRLKTAPKEEQS
jgi:signal transduction histidine kinase